MTEKENMPTKKPYPWKPVILWAIGIFIAGYLSTQPPGGNDGYTAIVFKASFAFIYMSIGGIFIGAYKYFRR